MAIETIPYPDTDSLARAQKGFYAVKIHVSHRQLRHYISTPEPDLLYYASSNDIYCLNTATKKRKHIATLPFGARCTASGYGYVCVGGEQDGHFAAIKLDGTGPRSLEVDSALPIEPWRRVGNGAGRGAASVEVKRIGEDIVNSISIHRIQDEEAHLDDIVAVLTNNDKTVRIYSLPQNRETTVLDLPFAVNHATISPDGQTLVAVGDFNQAYFFQQEIQETPPQIPKPHNRLTSESIEWTLTGVVNLHATEDPLGYFTTAWSPNGRLVAVGSEGGFVTVFDMNILLSSDFDDEDAVIAVVPGSRPNQPYPYPGAILSMMFAPDPWDLLIWAEGEGRICIGDVRTGLRTKQVIHLEPKGEDLDRLVIDDVPADGDLPFYSSQQQTRDMDELEADFIRRYRQAPDHQTAVNFATEYIEARRRQRQQRQDLATLRSQANSAGVSALEDDPQGLTAREQQILESLRTSRQREEARVNGPARTVNYTYPDLVGSGHRASSAAQHATTAALARPIGEILSSGADSLLELPRTNAASPHPSSSHRNDTTTSPPPYAYPPDNRRVIRLGDPSRLPRRRQSVILSPPSSNPDLPSPEMRIPRPPIPTTNTTNPEVFEDENPWRTIEEHMTIARGPLFESANRVAAASPLPAASTALPPLRSVAEEELAAELAAERARARSLARQRDRYRGLRAEAAAADVLRHNVTAADTLRRVAGLADGYEVLMRRARVMDELSDDGVHTAGLAMSADGSVLWAACREGIFEIALNRKGRLFWPSRDPR